MNRFYKIFICYGIFPFLLFSCKVGNQIRLVQNDIPSINKQVYQSTHDIQFVPNDILFVNVITNNEEINDVFSQKANTVGNQSVPSYENGLAAYRGFKVNLDGIIDFPILGPIKVQGKTSHELELELRTSLIQFANEVKVIVKLANFRVTILGDVKNPKSLIIPDEKITVFELLGLSGDVNITADVKNVTLIRDYNGKIVKQRIDLTNSDLINSEFYFLKQNDVLYIPPKNNKYIFNNYVPFVGSILSGITVILSLTTILVR
jgi:polysaccharide export outer membrane protein